MTERSWFWGGTTVGDAALAAPYGAPYSDDMFSDVFAFLFSNDRTVQGVIPTLKTGYTGMLAATYDNSAVTIASGAGLVDGKLYASDGSVALNFPGDGTFYVVLRKSWGAQTVRLALITTASLAQNDGATWEVPIHRLVRAGGVVTGYQDYRNWVGGAPPTRAINPFIYGPVADSTYPWSFQLRENQTDYVVYNFLLPDDFVSNLKVELLLSASTTGANIRITRATSTVPFLHQEWGYTSLFTTTETVAVANSGPTEDAYTQTVFDDTIDMTTTMRDYRGQYINVKFTRLGSDVLDTLSGIVYVRGVRITYRGV